MLKFLCARLLDQVPLNPAYLVVEDHQDIEFRVDPQGLFEKPMTVTPKADEKNLYSFSEQFLIGLKEISYRIEVEANPRDYEGRMFKEQSKLNITHGLFIDGAFFSG